MVSIRISGSRSLVKGVGVVYQMNPQRLINDGPNLLAYQCQPVRYFFTSSGTRTEIMMCNP